MRENGERKEMLLRRREKSEGFVVGFFKNIGKSNVSTDRDTKVRGRFA